MGGDAPAAGALLASRLLRRRRGAHGSSSVTRPTRRRSRPLPLEDAFIVVSSKSGTSLETERCSTTTPAPANATRVGTPSSPTPARRSPPQAKNFRVNRVFENRPDIGGRYSVLSYFGMVPAVLLGYDLEELCGRAMEIDRSVEVSAGIAMAEAALEGQDKTTLACDDRPAPRSACGSRTAHRRVDRKGRPWHRAGPDRRDPSRARIASRRSPLERAHELGAAFFDFEIRTAIAAHILGVDPFDAPERRGDDGRHRPASSASSPLPTQHRRRQRGPAALWSWLDERGPDGRLRRGRGVPPLRRRRRARGAAAVKIRDRNDGIAVTAGGGQQILHSTAQLHLGGPNTVIAIQLLPFSPRSVLAIPGSPVRLRRPRSTPAPIGERRALSHRRGRRLLRIAARRPRGAALTTATPCPRVRTVTAALARDARARLRRRPR